MKFIRVLKAGEEVDVNEIAEYIKNFNFKSKKKSAVSKLVLSREYANQLQEYVNAKYKDPIIEVSLEKIPKGFVGTGEYTITCYILYLEARKRYQITIDFWPDEAGRLNNGIPGISMQHVHNPVDTTNYY